MTFSKLILSLCLIGFLGTGCSNNNYEQQENGSSKTSEDDGQNRASDNNDEKKETEEKNGETSFTFSASSKHTMLGGARQVFNYDAENERLEVLIPLPEELSTIGFEGTLPNHPQISFNLDVVRSAIVISMPLKNYLDLVKNPSGLPNGRPLPGINGGEPPSFGFPLPFNNVNAFGYAAVDSLSLYVEFDWFLSSLSLRVPIYSDQDKNQRVGQIYILSKVNEYSSGLFLTLSLPDELSVLIANAQ